MRADAEDAEDAERSGTPTGPGDADAETGTGDGETRTGTAAGGETETAVDRALAAFRAGDPVCVHDFADARGRRTSSTRQAQSTRRGSHTCATTRAD